MASTGNAIWLLVAMPKWFFGSVMNPMAGGLLSVIPVAGIMCLAIGIGLGIRSRATLLLLFLWSPALSTVFVVMAGAFRGQLQQPAPVMIGFLVAQWVLLGWIVYRCKDTMTAALLLALFSFSYGLFAAFIAGMAFTDAWL